MKALILCCGNPLRGDDAVGWRVGEIISESISDRDVRTLVTNQMTPELAEDIAQADLLIVVDSSLSESGTKIEEVKADLPKAFSGWSHCFELRDILSLSLEMFGRCPRTFVVGVRAKSFALGQSLSQETEMEAKKAVALISKLLRNQENELDVGSCSKYEDK